MSALCLENIPGIILECDTGLTVLYASPSVSRDLGHNPDEVTGRSIVEFTHPKDASSLRRALARVTRSPGAVSRVQTRFRHKSGTWRHLAGEAKSYTDISGRVRAVIHAYEVSRLKKAEKRSAESEELHRAAIEHSMSGMAVVRGGRHVRVNRRFLELFGFDKPSDIIGKSVAAIAHPDDVEMLNERVVRRERGEPVPARYTFRGLRRDGEQIIIEVSGAQTTYRGRAASLNLLRDITERRQVEEKLRKSEATMRLVFSASPVGIVLLDESMAVTGINHRLNSITGYRPEELIGRDMGIFYRADEERFRVEEAVYEDVRQCGMGSTDTKWVRKNGDIRDIYLNAAAVDPGNLSMGMIVTAVDITERKEAEKRLSESEERYRTAVEESNDGVSLLKEGRHIYVNEKFVRMFGYGTRDEILDMPVPAFVHPDDREAVAEYSRKRNCGEEVPNRYEFKGIRKDGSAIYIEASIATTTFRGEKVTFAYLRDITGRKCSEQMLAQALAELETTNTELKNANMELKESQEKIIQQEKMASIGQLAAGVAHEINNPMGFIISNLNSLEKYTKKIGEFVRLQDEALGLCESKKTAMPVADARRSLKIDYVLEDSPTLISESLEGAQRVKRIVQDLKSFSRVDGAGYGTADLNNVMESTLNIIWNELKYKATVKKNYGPIRPIICNPGQLSQVFMNLLLNAVQAIPEAGEIGIRTWDDSLAAYVAISDTGAGISEDKLNRIFEPFFTTKEVGNGTGLGLSIVYDIVKKHKGEIEVASELGKGSVFTIKIPKEAA